MNQCEGKIPVLKRFGMAAFYLRAMEAPRHDQCSTVRCQSCVPGWPLPLLGAQCVSSLQPLLLPLRSVPALSSRALSPSARHLRSRCSSRSRCPAPGLSLFSLGAGLPWCWCAWSGPRLVTAGVSQGLPRGCSSELFFPAEMRPRSGRRPSSAPTSAIFSSELLTPLHPASPASQPRLPAAAATSPLTINTSLVVIVAAVFPAEFGGVDHPWPDAGCRHWRATGAWQL